MNKEKLLEKIYEELFKVIEEGTQAQLKIKRAKFYSEQIKMVKEKLKCKVDLKDEIIPTLSGWELALKWVINEINELEVSA
jgi:hypothetical protein